MGRARCLYDLFVASELEASLILTLHADAGKKTISAPWGIRHARVAQNAGLWQTFQVQYARFRWAHCQAVHR